MNKEELESVAITDEDINNLVNEANKIGNVDVSELVEKAKEEEAKLNSSIDQNNDLIASNNLKIEELEKLLENEENFYDRTPMEYYYVLEAEQINIQDELKTNIEQEKNNLAKINEKISTRELYVGYLDQSINNLEERNVFLNIEIRRGRLTSDNDLVVKSENEIAANKNRVLEFIEKKRILLNQIEDSKKDLVDINAKIEGYIKETEESVKQQEQIAARADNAKTSDVVVSKKDVVLNQLAVLKSVNNFLEEQVNNSYIKLVDVKNEADIAVINSKLSQNRIMQEQLEVQKSVLASKISDDKNYKLLPIQKTKINLRADMLLSKISEYDLQIEYLNRQIDTDKNVNIVDCENIISTKLKENNDLARQAIINGKNDPELIQQLEAKENLNLIAIREARTMIESIKADEVNNNIIIEQLKERKQRSEIVLANLKATLANENAIDNSQRRLDQIELSNMERNFSALKNEEEYLNSILIEKQNEINLDKKKDAEIPLDNQKIVPTTLGEAIDPNKSTDINKVEEDIEEFNFDNFNKGTLGLTDKQIRLLKKANEPSFKSKMNDFFNAKKEKLSDHLANEKEKLKIKKSEKASKKEKIKVIKTSEVNHKLRQKAKDSKFAKNLKNHLAAVALIAATCVTLAFSAKNVGLFFSLINNPAVMEKLANEADDKEKLTTEVESLVDSLLDENSLTPVDDDQKQFLMGESSGNYTEYNPVIDGTKATEDYFTESTPGTDDLEYQESKENIDSFNIDNSGVSLMLPNPTPSQGTQTIITGVTGNETVPNSAWDNEQLKNDTGAPNLPNNGNNNGVPDSAWDNEEPVIEEPVIEEPVIEEPVVEEPVVEEPVVEDVLPEVPVNQDGQVVLDLKEGEAIVMKNADSTLVVSNNSNSDLIPENAQVIGNTEPGQSLNITFNENDIKREEPLSEEEANAITYENGLTAEQIAEIEAFYSSIQQNQVNSSDAEIADEITRSR